MQVTLYFNYNFDWETVYDFEVVTSVEEYKDWLKENYPEHLEELIADGCTEDENFKDELISDDEFLDYIKEAYRDEAYYETEEYARDAYENYLFDMEKGN